VDDGAPAAPCSNGGMGRALVLVAAILGVARAETTAIVYLHYERSDDRAVIERIADTLGAFDYDVRDKRFVAQPTEGDVRYFHPEDRTAAEHVRAIVGQILAAEGRRPALALLDRSARFPDARRGLVEVWLPPSGLR
jgi:hypothetical protein